MKHELRINNYVLFEGEIITVKSIEYNPVTGNHFIRIEEDFRQIITDYLEPIPITEELLVKNCKFTKINERLFVKGRLLICIHQDMATFTDDITTIRLKGLHHLQNVFYCKHDTELTIEI